MRNRASLTAECMALFRAIESSRPASDMRGYEFYRLASAGAQG